MQSRVSILRNFSFNGSAIIGALRGADDTAVFSRANSIAAPHCPYHASSLMSASVIGQCSAREWLRRLHATAREIYLKDYRVNRGTGVSRDALVGYQRPTGTLAGISACARAFSRHDSSRVNRACNRGSTTRAGVAIRPVRFRARIIPARIVPWRRKTGPSLNKSWVAKGRALGAPDDGLAPPFPPSRVPTRLPPLCRSRSPSLPRAGANWSSLPLPALVAARKFVLPLLLPHPATQLLLCACSKSAMPLESAVAGLATAEIKASPFLSLVVPFLIRAA